MDLIEHIKAEYKKDKKPALFFVFSPSSLAASYSKSKKNTKDKVRDFIIARNWRYFIIAPMIALAVGVSGIFESSQ